MAEQKSTPPKWTVGGPELAEALGRMRQAVKSGRGLGTWVITPTALSVEWSGAYEEVPVSGEGSATVTVLAAAMRTLAGACPQTSPLTLSVTEGRLKFGTFSIACAVPLDKAPELLAVASSTYDLLLLGYSRSTEELNAAGLTGDVDGLDEKRAMSVDKAADRLSWLGIDAGLLNTWVHAHLAAAAEGKDSFEVGPRKKDDHGQLGMFAKHLPRQK